ncbi:MAG: serine/threonine protein kinase [Deltaproteobacteria bacterium]|nr:serine/threonine protein kinase [Deltaproteobacteria bacterium]
MAEDRKTFTFHVIQRASGARKVESIQTLNTDRFLGRHVGTCTIIKELGRGSMGIVYVAYQRSLKRPVAVKILPKVLIKDLISARLFQQEAETIAILNHPNIIPVYEVGETEDFYFLIMQLVQGMALSDIMDRALKHVVPYRRLIPLEDTLRMVMQVLEALDYAHEEGIIHRDIKPANILVEERTQRAMISDFGIAKAIMGEDLNQGVIVGTPNYMAPEQASGKELDGRADIYAVGCMLFEMVAGKLPFREEKIMDLVRRKANEPESVFLRRPSEINPRISPELEKIILRAVMANPDDRFSSGREFKEALENFRTFHKNN